MDTLQLIVLVLIVTIPRTRSVDDPDDYGWKLLTNNEFASTHHPLTAKENSGSCRDFLADIKARHQNIVGKDEGVFFNIKDNEANNIKQKRFEFSWMEAKERAGPITDVLPLEGTSFCISGKHYKNSWELSQQPNFLNLTPMIEAEFNIGSHINPKDFSKMNFFRPNFTNTVGITHKQFLGKGDYNHFYDPKDTALFTHLGFAPNVQAAGGTTSFAESEQFYLKWKAADPTFFHVQRTRLRYKYDPGPYIRRLEDYVGATALKGDPNPGYLYRPAHPDNQPDPECKNPYFIEVTEIEVNNVRLHNWLHITVYVRKENLIKSPIKRCATGKMRYLLLEVRDSMGLPIGDFDSEVPCGLSCKCKSAKCRLVHGRKKNSMPCMFTPTRALTQPGLFMYGVQDEFDWFNEVHATWHFAQHSSYFAQELHFSALIVETKAETVYYNGRRTAYRNPRECVEIGKDKIIEFQTGDPTKCTVKNNPIFTWAWDDVYRLNDHSIYDDLPDKPCSNHTGGAHFHYGHHKEFWAVHRKEEYYAWSLQHLSRNSRPYGWNAQYTMLKPTLQTLGAWDYFKFSKLVDLNHTNCHRKLDEDFYEHDIGRTLRGTLPSRRNFYNFRRDWELHEETLATKVNKSNHDSKALVSRFYNFEVAYEAASNDTSDFENIYMQLPLNINVTNPFKRLPDDTYTFENIFQMNRVYFGTLGTKMAYEDQVGVVNPPPHQRGYDGEFEISVPGKYFSSLKTMSQIALDERCACPGFGTTPDPDTATKELTELQGRNAHAVQMLLAWVVLIPLGMFVARYYKETFARVYILEEFWWYTTHVMCMGTAFILMLGGIYSIEVKHITRETFDNWSEESRAHVILGGITIVLFALQMILSPIRMWIVNQRIVNIILHFAFGVMTYLLGAVAVLISVAIPQSRMSCSAFYMYITFLGIQLLLYIYMEIHMRYVDRILLLYPPRTYLPPPIIRVFHTNAPLSIARMYILIAYVLICWIMFFIIRYGAIEIEVASCFKNLGNDYEEDA